MSILSPNSALGILVGGVAGFALGGVPGAIKGSLIGGSLSLLFTSLLFDHDGTISKEEVADMVYAVVGGFIGTALGVSKGGLKGGLVGFTAGASLGLLVSKITFDHDGTISKDEIGNMISTAVLGLAGAAIGAMLGGAPGALIGFTARTALSLLVNSFVLDWGQIADDVVNNFNNLKDTCLELWEDLGGVYLSIKTAIVDKVGEAKTTVEEWWKEQKGKIEDKVATLKTEVIDKVGKSKISFTDWWVD